MRSSTSPLLDQALNHGDVDPSLELLATAAQTTDLAFRNVEKLAQPVAPLLHELLAVNENQGVDAALGDQPSGDDRLSERGRRGQNAGVVRQHGGGRHLLFGAKGGDGTWRTAHDRSRPVASSTARALPDSARTYERHRPERIPPLRRAVLQGDTSAFVQSSTEIPGTRLNSSVFAVTTIRPFDRACPAII